MGVYGIVKYDIVYCGLLWVYNTHSIFTRGMIFSVILAILGLGLIGLKINGVEVLTKGFYGIIIYTISKV